MDAREQEQQAIRWLYSHLNREHTEVFLPRNLFRDLGLTAFTGAPLLDRLKYLKLVIHDEPPKPSDRLIAREMELHLIEPAIVDAYHELSQPPNLVKAFQERIASHPLGAFLIVVVGALTAIAALFGRWLK